MKIQNNNQSQRPTASVAQLKSTTPHSNDKSRQRETATVDQNAKFSQLDDKANKAKSVSRLTPSQLHDLNCVVGEKNALISIKSLKDPNIGFRVHQANGEDSKQLFHAKTLVFKSKKTGESVAFVLSMDKQVNKKSPYFKSVVPGGKCSFLEHVELRTGFVPGGVNPMIKDMDVHIDKSVTDSAADNERFAFGGGSPKKIMEVDSAILAQLPGRISFGEFSQEKK